MIIFNQLRSKGVNSVVLWSQTIYQATTHATLFSLSSVEAVRFIFLTTNSCQPTPLIPPASVFGFSPKNSIRLCLIGDIDQLKFFRSSTIKHLKSHNLRQSLHISQLVLICKNESRVWYHVHLNPHFLWCSTTIDIRTSALSQNEIIGQQSNKKLFCLQHAVRLTTFQRVAMYGIMGLFGLCVSGMCF